MVTYRSQLRLRAVCTYVTAVLPFDPLYLVSKSAAKSRKIWRFDSHLSYIHCCDAAGTERETIVFSWPKMQ